MNRSALLFSSLSLVMGLFMVLRPDLMRRWAKAWRMDMTPDDEAGWLVVYRIAGTAAVIGGAAILLNQWRNAAPQ